MKAWREPFLEPEALQLIMRRLMTLDLILCEEKWLRVHRYEPDWLNDAALGIVDNGAGDDLYVVFAPDGIVIKGFDHHSPLSPHAREDYEVWPGMYEEAPEKLLAYLDRDPDLFDREDVTFCLWRSPDDTHWWTGELEDAEGLDDGSDFLFGYLLPTPEEYVDWAETYFGKSISFEAVRHVYAGGVITGGLVAELNPSRNVQEALDELKSLGVQTELA